LLQELRVAQTGVQLTGFLPTLPFQQRFDRLDDAMRHALVAVSASAHGVGFGWAPAGVPDGIQAAAAD